MTASDEQLLNVQEAAFYLSMSGRMIRRLISRDQVPVYVDKAELDKWVDQHKFVMENGKPVKFFMKNGKPKFVMKNGKYVRVKAAKAKIKPR